MLFFVLKNFPFLSPRRTSDNFGHLRSSYITPIKEAQDKIEAAANTFKSVFNVAQAGMFTFTPEYNNQGEIIDFRYVMANTTFANNKSSSLSIGR